MMFIAKYPVTSSKYDEAKGWLLGMKRRSFGALRSAKKLHCTASKSASKGSAMIYERS